MIGKVHVINKKSGKIALTVNSSELDYNIELRERIKNNYLNKDYFTIQCGCNKSIELNIDKLNRIYHKKHSDISKHNSLCPRNSLTPNRLFDVGWKESVNYMSVQSSINLSFTEKNKDNISLSKFIELLNCYTWNNIMYSKNEYPMDRFEFLRSVYLISKNIKMKNLKNQTLQSMYFNLSEFKNIKDEYKFINMYIHSIEDSLMKNRLKVVCEYAENRYFNYFVDKNKFEERYKNLKIGNHKNLNILISGFCTKNKNHMYLCDFDLNLVSSKGLICKDVSEVKLFNYFTSNEIKYIKPYRPIMIYNGHKPTLIILGTSQIDIFVEIFSKSTEKELVNRSKIINYMKYNLSKSHKLIIWDAYKNSGMPSIKYINTLINNDRKVKK